MCIKINPLLASTSSSETLKMNIITPPSNTINNLKPHGREKLISTSSICSVSSDNVSAFIPFYDPVHLMCVIIRECVVGRGMRGGWWVVGGGGHAADDSPPLSHIKEPSSYRKWRESHLPPPFTGINLRCYISYIVHAALLS